LVGVSKVGEKVSRPTKRNPLAPEKTPHTRCVIPQLTVFKNLLPRSFRLSIWGFRITLVQGFPT
jgi:hypothetical protein